LLDDFALHLELVQLLRCRATDRKCERLARFSLEHIHRLGHADVFGELVVDLENLIAGEDPGAGGGTVLPGGHDGKDVTFSRDGDANSLVGAVGVTLELVEDFRLHELTVRVEIGEHALEGTVDQLLVSHLFRIDIPLTDRLEHFGEEFYFLKPRIGLFRLLCARSNRPCRQRCQPRKE